MSNDKREEICSRTAAFAPFDNAAQQGEEVTLMELKNEVELLLETLRAREHEAEELKSQLGQTGWLAASKRKPGGNLERHSIDDMEVAAIRAQCMLLEKKIDKANREIESLTELIDARSSDEDRRFPTVSEFLIKENHQCESLDEFAEWQSESEKLKVVLEKSQNGCWSCLTEDEMAGRQTLTYGDTPEEALENNLIELNAKNSLDSWKPIKQRTVEADHRRYGERGFATAEHDGAKYASERMRGEQHAPMPTKPLQRR